jgi:hypothetical protein
MRMKSIGRDAARVFPRLIVRCLAFFCLAVLPLCAQSFSSSPDTLSTGGAPNASSFHAVLTLDGPWRFQIGDDLRWAEPGFDDSSWPTVVLSQSLSAQGFSTYSGFAWYRMRLTPQQLSAFRDFASNTPLDLLVSGDSVGQLAIFVNGIVVGSTRGMTDDPAMYQSPAFAAHLSAPDATGARVLAIRTWAGPGVTIGRGLLVKVEIGAPTDIADRLSMATGRQWNEHVTAGILVTFLFFCVAVLGLALFLAQRHHSEYLWLTLLCLSVAAGGFADVAFGLAWMPLSIYHFFTMWMGRIFIAVTLEFVLRFTGNHYRKVVRGVQIGVLLVPLISMLPFPELTDVLSVTAEVTFCSLVCFLLFHAWRSGQGEAGIMLGPFFLAATADSADTIVDYFAKLHILPEQFASHRFHLGPIEFGTGTVSYTVFLGSLVAVILYRFIGVSQEEQRSSAEIAAARSVQALLIPTQLPSNRNFMLESAYLPVNGVGGDFFQVLPLKDDSLLIVVGDVSGKGLQAAMNSSTLVGALRNELSHDPGTVLDHLNRVLLGAVSTPGAVPGLDSAPCFATCLCARVYPDGNLTIANAGHLSPYRDGRELPLPPGLPLGVIADSHYEQTTFQLNRGDRLVFLSDGVVEATNHEGELFGFERTQQVSNEPARYIAQTAQRFGQTDDITVVSLYVASRAAQRSSEEALQTS